ncbi:hypothetical protein C0J52_10728 [Blattella germanica]|nr:hypothetical protein C0J52_10728 [Blattella germanica]
MASQEINVISSLKSVFYIYQVFGLTTLSFSKSGLNFSYIGLLWSLLWFFFNFVGTIEFCLTIDDYISVYPLNLKILTILYDFSSRETCM